MTDGAGAGELATAGLSTTGTGATTGCCRGVTTQPKSALASPTQRNAPAELAFDNQAITMRGDMIICLAIASTKPKRLHPAQGEDVQTRRAFSSIYPRGIDL